MLSFIKNEVAAAAQTLFGQTIDANAIQLNPTPPEFKGDCTIVVFPFTKFSKLGPEPTATAIGNQLKLQLPTLADFNVVKGFLNLTLSDEFWLNQFQSKFNQESVHQITPNDKRVMVEYSSPNTNKPLHLGHVRNNLLGHAIAEILGAAGNHVIKANLINDRGIHICKSMIAWQKFGNGETPASASMKGDHLVGKYYVLFDQAYKKEIAQLISEGKTEDEAKAQAPIIIEAQNMLRDWEDGNEAVLTLWKTMNEWVYAGFNETYAKMGVSFDKMYYESQTYLLGKDIIKEGLESGVFFQKPDNSVWIDLTADGLDQKLVQRSDGTSVYITQDIGTAQKKYDDFNIDQSIYVVGNEQDYHFKVLQLICKKLNKPYADGIYHMSYGMVELPTGKMKSREGTVVDADDLMKEMIESAKTITESAGKDQGFSEREKSELYNDIGLGALKFFLLKIDPKKKMLFNPEESIDFHGFTGPFVQYTHARIQSILRKANDENSHASINLSETHSLNNEEKELVMALLQLNNKIKEAADNLSPAIIANYAYQIAKSFNTFYAEHSVLKAENTQKEFRLALATYTAKVLKYTLHLIGINAPNKM
ncbi:MAG: arginine--tRNA ligase [Chitinophagales bacterium]|nr:arginine--tRNA ligase [Chitinophagales bacterium]